MIRVVIKVPEQSPEVQDIESVDALEEIMEGEFELAYDDHLEGISILVNEEVRGIKPHNFTIEAEGSHDWVYGTAIFTRLEEGMLRSLSEEEIDLINHYFSKTRAYK